MTPIENSEQNLITTETEIGSNGVGHSKVQGSKGGAAASPKELMLALELSQQTIANLEREVAEMKAAKPAQDDSINKLAEILANAVAVKQPGPINTDNFTSSQNYSKKTTIDGQNLMEAQATLMMYKNEPKVPVSVPKSFVNVFGPSLPVAVNGVRVSIPCDGKTYYINKTHAEHIRERIAKVDRLQANTEDEVITMIA